MLASYYVNRMLSRPRLLPVPRQNRQRGFSLIELLIVIAIILIILSIALPQMGKARMHAQEMAALKTINTVNTVEVQYYSQFGKYGTLAQLGPPAAAGTQEGPEAAALIPASLASGASSGYLFTVTQTPTGYAVTAVPKAFGSTGRRTFYSDQSGVTRYNDGQDPPTATSPEVK
jgi:type IV pilus assembly protein PilA